MCYFSAGNTCATAVDVRPDCNVIKNSCLVPEFLQFMRDNCARTCCDFANPSGKCFILGIFLFFCLFIRFAIFVLNDEAFSEPIYTK